MTTSCRVIKRGVNHGPARGDFAFDVVADTQAQNFTIKTVAGGFTFRRRDKMPQPKAPGDEMTFKHAGVKGFTHGGSGRSEIELVTQIIRIRAVEQLLHAPTPRKFVITGLHRNSSPAHVRN